MNHNLKQAIQQELIEQETFVRLESTNTMNYVVTLHTFVSFQ